METDLNGTQLCSVFVIDYIFPDSQSWNLVLMSEQIIFTLENYKCSGLQYSEWQPWYKC